LLLMMSIVIDDEHHGCTSLSSARADDDEAVRGRARSGHRAAPKESSGDRKWKSGISRCSQPKINLTHVDFILALR
jgi:hypothetical protein